MYMNLIETLNFPTESPDGEITFASMQKSYRNTELIAQ